MKLRYLQSFYKSLSHGFTLMIIPNASYKKIRNFRIPFILMLLILCVIIFNIFIFFSYTTQIWQIAHFKQKIARHCTEIAKLNTEKPKVAPVLEKNRVLESKLELACQLNEKIADSWERIHRKDKSRFLMASRGGWHLNQNVPAYRLTGLPQTNKANVTTSLEILDHNLAQLDTIVELETENQQSLLRELLAYEHKLDHTPSSWPVYSRIRSAFGRRFHPVYRTYKTHQGVDLVAKHGTKVMAAASGKVSFSGWKSGYGYIVIIQHDYGYETRYGHLSQLLTHTGNSVKKGQLIALSGNTGTSTGPHLHYEVRINGNPVNPVRYLKD